MDEVSINGVFYPIKFSLNTKRLFCKDKGIELYEFGDIFAKEDDDVTIGSVENLSLFILYAFKEGARKANKDFNFIIDDIVECFSEEPDVITNALDIFKESEAIPEGKQTPPLGGV